MHDIVPGLELPPPPQRIVKKGAQLAERGQLKLKLWNMLKIKEFSGKLRSKKV
jgi:hypothetical protein